MSGFIRRRKTSTGSWKYYPCVKVNGREKQIGGFSSRRSTELALSKAEKEIAAGSFGREELAFGAFYERWIASKHNLKPSTRVSYEQTFRLHILPTFEDNRLGEITPLDVQEWIDGLAASGMNPATVARCFRYFRACMKQAEAWSLLDRAPT